MTVTTSCLLYQESAGLQEPKHATGALFGLTGPGVVHIFNTKRLPPSISAVLLILIWRYLILKKRQLIPSLDNWAVNL
jgi:hypothetical protein